MKAILPIFQMCKAHNIVLQFAYVVLLLLVSLNEARVIASPVEWKLLRGTE